MEEEPSDDGRDAVSQSKTWTMTRSFTTRIRFEKNCVVKMGCDRRHDGKEGELVARNSHSTSMDEVAIRTRGSSDIHRAS